MSCPPAPHKNFIQINIDGKWYMVPIPVEPKTSIRHIRVIVPQVPPPPSPKKSHTVAWIGGEWTYYRSPSSNAGVQPA